MSKTLILGCGPAGLIAAQAAFLCGSDVTIYSRKVMSPIYGAQYLHEPIEGVSPKDPEGYINFVMLGTPEGYQQKLFGDPLRKSGWWQYCETPMVPAWDIRRAYAQLFETFQSSIRDVDLDAEEMARLEWDSWDYIFNSVPLWNLCARYKPEPDLGGLMKSPHTFEKYKVQVQPSQPISVAEQVKNIHHRVIYNGRPEDAWFRSSYVFGVDGGYEYPIEAKVDGGKMIRKPLSNTCNCWPHITRIGRYGAWDMNYLTHDSFEIVRKVIEGDKDATKVQSVLHNDGRDESQSGLSTT